ncbi:MAG: flavin reductase family protein [Acidimicrobiales bacterium]
MPQGQDPEAYDRLRRRILWLMPNGLYVLGTRAGGERNLMTISWVTQVALEPKAIGVGVERSARTHALMLRGGVFSLNVLPRAERALVRKFVKPVEKIDIDEQTGAGTMNGVAVSSSPSGVPVLESCVAFLDCEVRHRLELGSHDWFVGEVVDCGYGSAGTPDQAEAGSGEALTEVLRMEDTRMSYGG